MSDRPRVRAAWPLEETLRGQRDGCERLGSRLYARVLDAVLSDLTAGGVCADVLRPHADAPFGSALPLRFLGAVHRVVLEGRAPGLAAHYPSVGGTDEGDPGPAFLDAVRAEREEIERRIHDGVQTNEVARAAVLVGGFAEVARRTGLPLRVLEVGTSAGLNLRWDHFWYDTGSSTFGDPASPVRFSGCWDGPPPDLGVPMEVVERRGCDRSPIDPTIEDGRLTLVSYIWPDQLERIARLDAAIEVARRVPATIETADAGDWVEANLAEAAPDTATVVVHSIVLQYLPTESRRRLRDALVAAGGRARPDATIHWLRMEPVDERADVQLTSWTGSASDGVSEVLATCGYHGAAIAWSPSSG